MYVMPSYACISSVFTVQSETNLLTVDYGKRDSVSRTTLIINTRAERSCNTLSGSGHGSSSSCCANYSVRDQRYSDVSVQFDCLCVCVCVCVCVRLCVCDAILIWQIWKKATTMGKQERMVKILMNYFAQVPN